MTKDRTQGSVEGKVRDVLEKHASSCLDNEEEREAILKALTKALDEEPAEKKPLFIYSSTLGAALEVRYTREGLVAFVFLDDEDVSHVIPTIELDEGWQKNLLAALNGVCLAE